MHNTTVANLVDLKLINLGWVPWDSLSKAIDGLNKIGVYINKDVLEK